MNGLSVYQGVIIPAGNRRNLMLKAEVIEAVGRKEFHIWAVTNVDQGIEILTGLPAGERLDDGSWPERTVNWLADGRLQAFAEVAARYGSEMVVESVQLEEEGEEAEGSEMRPAVTGDNPEQPGDE